MISIPCFNNICIHIELKKGKFKKCFNLDFI